MGLFGMNPGSVGFAAPDDEATQVRRVKDLERAVGEMFADGTSRALVDNLPATVAATLAAGISTTSVNASGNVTTGGYLVSLPGTTFDITTTRLTAWWRTSDGRLAFASSSRSKKSNIRDSGIDPLAILKIEDVLYNYTAEMRKRDDPTYEDYYGSDYHVAEEVGAIAEQLHELGLWQFVQYEQEPDPAFPTVWSEAVLDENGEIDIPAKVIREGVTRTKVGKDGQPIPVSIHYTMLAIGLLPVLRMLHEQVTSQAEQIAAITKRLDAQGL